MTCRKANAGFRVNDCFEACENTPGAISQVWKHYANNICAQLPDSHSDHSCLPKEHTGVSTGTRSPNFDSKMCAWPSPDVAPPAQGDRASYSEGLVNFQSFITGESFPRRQAQVSG